MGTIVGLTYHGEVTLLDSQASFAHVFGVDQSNIILRSQFSGITEDEVVT